MYNRQLSEDARALRNYAKWGRRNESEGQNTRWSAYCACHDVADFCPAQRRTDSGSRGHTVSHDRGSLGDLRAAICEVEIDTFFGLAISWSRLRLKPHRHIRFNFDRLAVQEVWFEFPLLDRIDRGWNELGVT